MTERVHVSVLVEIDGDTVVDDAYDTDSRAQAAGDFEDWADAIRGRQRTDDPDEMVTCHC